MPDTAIEFHSDDPRLPPRPVVTSTATSGVASTCDIPFRVIESTLTTSGPFELLRPPTKPRPSVEDLVFRPALFQKTASPVLIEGRADNDAGLFYGGLFGCGYPWSDFAHKFARDGEIGGSAEIHSLKGHDGTWEGLRNTSASDWVDDIVQSAGRMRQPLFFGYSTGGLAGLVAEAENPGLFKAMAVVGVPLELQQLRQRLMLQACHFVHELIAPIWTGGAALLENWVFPSDDSDLREGSKLMRRNPHYRFMPGATLLALAELQERAADVLHKVTAPVLIMQGGRDRVVAKDVPQRLSNALSSAQTTLQIFENSGHAPHLGPDRGLFIVRMFEWIQELKAAMCTRTATSSEGIGTAASEDASPILREPLEGLG